MWNKVKNILRQPDNTFVVGLVLATLITMLGIEACHGQARSMQRGGAGIPFTAYPFGIQGAIEWQTGYIRRADQRDLAENNLMDEPIPGFWDSLSNYVNFILYID